MLINDFYNCLDIHKGENEFNCRVVFDPGHAIFKGHFPGQPVVPGVCMMEIVKELLQQQTDKSLVLRNAGNVKFLQLITPEIQPTVNISWKEGNAGYSVSASFNNGGATLFKLNGNYEWSS